jgi:ornithine decarboxylase
VSRSQPKKISVPSTVKINTFISKHSPSTPFLVVDLEVVAAKYADMRRTMPRGDIFYAVKANPAPEVLSLLAGLGSNFDVASPGEIDLVLAAGATPERISYGNTIKKEADIAYAYAKGVRLFAFDSENELQKLSRSAPNAHVFCRILTTCDGADWPLSRKFGCELDMASTLLKMARDLKLQPRGVSFHVGSQQTRLDQWDRPLEQAAQLFRELRDSGITLDLVNIGGGLPAQYRDKIESIDSYAAAIRAAFSKYFGDE